MQKSNTRELNVTPNNSKRTFTIRTSEGLKYRTGNFTRQDFEHARRNWTGNDWQNYLRTSGDYSVIK